MACLAASTKAQADEQRDQGVQGNQGGEVTTRTRDLLRDRQAAYAIPRASAARTEESTSW
jgi:hypothetical protein